MIGGLEKPYLLRQGVLVLIKLISFENNGDTAHQRFGGALQVALSFINECRAFPNMSTL